MFGFKGIFGIPVDLGLVIPFLVGF